MYDSPTDNQLHAGVRFPEPYASIMNAVVDAQNKRLAALGMPATATVSSLTKAWVQERLLAEGQKFVALGELEVSEPIRKLLTVESIDKAMPQSALPFRRKFRGERTQALADQVGHLYEEHTRWRSRHLQAAQEGKNQVECKGLLAQIELFHKLPVLRGKLVEHKVSDYRKALLNLGNGWDMSGVDDEFDKIMQRVDDLLDEMNAGDIRAEAKKQGN